MQTQVKAWGNSQGVRISKEILQAAAISLDGEFDWGEAVGREVW